jgi:hypothetical protein
MKAPIARAFRGAWTPLLWYYAIAVVVPLLNGAASRDTLFFEHTVFVLLVPVVLVVLLSMGALRRAPLNPRSLRGSGSRSARGCGFGIKAGPR